jgi:hypothetical protein
MGLFHSKIEKQEEIFEQHCVKLDKMHQEFLEKAEKQFLDILQRTLIVQQEYLDRLVAINSNRSTSGSTTSIE